MESASVSAISLRHILASHGYTPWDNRGKCHMDEKRNMIQCLSNALQHVQPFPSNSTLSVSSKVRHFSTFWPPLDTPLGQSW